MLAGRYPPQFCRDIADAVHDWYPNDGLRSLDEPRLDSKWVCQLNRICGTSIDIKSLRRCPRHRLGDRGSFANDYSHFQIESNSSRVDRLKAIALEQKKRRIQAEPRDTTETLTGRRRRIDRGARGLVTTQTRPTQIATKIYEHCHKSQRHQLT